jgi:CheY-like chemotaxis protein
MLEELGHVVVEAPSAPKALDVLHREKVDLVITDHMMPKMTGLELMETIKRHWPDLPVILATGYAELPQGNSVKEKLTKPFSGKQLEQAIKSAATPPA